MEERTLPPSAGYPRNGHTGRRGLSKRLERRVSVHSEFSAVNEFRDEVPVEVRHRRVFNFVKFVTGTSKKVDLVRGQSRGWAPNLRGPGTGCESAGHT